MLDLRYVIKEKEEVILNLKRRNANISEVEELYLIAIERNNYLSKLSNLQAEKNEISSKIGVLIRNKEDTSHLLTNIDLLKESINNLENKVTILNEKINNLILNIPNIPLKDVPIGINEEDNVILNEYPNIGRGLVKAKKPHYQIAVEKDIIDFNKAAKLSGSRFVIYKNNGSKLIRALESFMLDFHEKNGYCEIMPPILVNEEMMQGTGQFPKFKEDVFKIEKRNLYLIPTAEVPLTNYFNNEIINLDKPIKFTAFTKCFRSEAGSAGKDTKGIIRMHQFNKVEIVQFANEKDALNAFDSVLKSAKKLLELLEIPYREVLLCTGDLGFSSRKTIDLELWLPSEQRYREVSSVSYFGDFQARRAKIRYRNENGETTFAHTINGSGLAIDRVVAAILEIYQNDDDSIDIPKVLIPFLKRETI